MIIQIRDYQSIVKANLVIERGITAIIGKSCSGKTAIMRAVTDLIYNSITDEDVRIGSENSKAVIAMKNKKNGTVIKIVRDPNASFKTTYIVNGEPISKVGKVKIDETDDLGLYAIDDIDIHFIRQEDLPFLVFESPQRTYDFLSKGSSSILKDVSLDMKAELDAVRNDLKEYTTEANIYSARYDEIRTSVSKLKDISKAVESEKIFKKSKSTSDNLDKIKKDLLNLDIEITKYEDKVDKLSKLIDSLDVNILSEISKFVSKLKDLEVVKKLKNESENKINGLTEKIDSFVDTTDIDLMLNSIPNKVLSNLKDLTKVKSSLETNNKKIKELPEIGIADINTDIYINSIDILGKFSRSSKLKSEYIVIESKINKLSDKIGDLNIQLIDYEDELSEYNICPTCNRPIIEGADDCGK